MGEEVDEEADALERRSAGSQEEMQEVLEQAWLGGPPKGSHSDSHSDSHSPPLVLLQEVEQKPSLEDEYPWLHRVVEATDPAIEARTVATIATAARIKAEREAVQATGASLTMDSEAQQGLRRLDVLHQRLASVVPDKAEPGDKVQPWTPKSA